MGVKFKSLSKLLLPGKNTNSIKLISFGLTLSLIKGYSNITIDDLAQETGISRQTIYNNFKTVDNLRFKILSYALAKQSIPIIIQAIGNNDPLVKNINKEIKLKVSEYILSYK